VDEPRTRFPTPTSWPDRLVLWAAEWKEWDGIPIALGSLQEEEDLRAVVVDALGLLATYAPADMVRARTLMRGLLVTKLHGSNAQWRQSLRICVLSTDYIRRRETTTEGVAAAIVHELTHARLDALGFKYGEGTRERIERICFHASKRFLEKLPESGGRTAALNEVEQYLAIDAAVWQAVLGRDHRPWYVRALAQALRLVTGRRRRDGPT
jgi:hypothetical protein